MIRANRNDYRTARYNIDPWAWHKIVTLAIKYQANEYGYDWENGIPPKPIPLLQTPGLLFARAIRATLIQEEFST